MNGVNINLDVVDPHTVRLNSMLESYGLIQNVSTTTRGSHLLDVIITQSDYPAAIKVEAPILSDHLLITASIDLRFNHGQPVNIVR
jgi:hypothetical protein